jgi:hypothetical protein
MVDTSVGDPDPNVFGHPGSASGDGSGFGSLHHQAKVVNKTLISNVS